MSFAQAFGEFSSVTRFDDLPEEVVLGAKLRVLDVIAATCAAIQENKESALIELLETAGIVSVWGTPYRRSLRDAIIINTSNAHACYFEDGSRYTGGHPASAVIPAAIACAQGRNISGKHLLASIAVGYEIFLRLGRAIYPSTVRRGFQSTAILAAPSAAAAIAHLLGLSARKAADAISIACSHGAGLKEALKSADSQPFQVGRSAEGGALSAFYAQLNVHGATEIFEQGFLKAFAQDAQVNGLVAELGQSWSLGETYFKIHGGCRGNHAPIDAAAMISQKYHFDVEAIEKIEAFVDSVTFAAAIEFPKNGEDTQFSVGFSIALMLSKNDALPARYTTETLNDPLIKTLMQKTKVSPSLDLDVGYPDRRPVILKIKLKDGRCIEQQLDHAKGEPENPMSIEDIRGKYQRLAQPVFGYQAKVIEQLVLTLERQESVDTLAELLVLTK